MSRPKDLNRYVANLQKEIDGAFLYTALADTEKQPKLSELYRRLASSEEKHASAWETRIIDAGIKFPSRKPSCAPAYWRSSPGGSDLNSFSPPSRETSRQIAVLMTINRKMILAGCPLMKDPMPVSSRWWEAVPVVFQVGS